MKKKLLVKKKCLVVFVMVIALCWGCSGLAWAAEEKAPDNEQTETMQEEKQEEVTPKENQTQQTESEPDKAEEKDLCAIEGHHWLVKIQSPTCTEMGRRYNLCANCGVEETTETYKAMGHEYVDTITKKATETEDGVRTYTCIRCQDSYTEVIPKWGRDLTEETEKKPCADGHRFSTDVQKEDSTCNEDGRYYVVCQVCGEKSTVQIIPKGHHWQVEHIDATCIVEGQVVRVCKLCGEREVAQNFGKSGHHWKQTTDATSGKVYRTCQFCGLTELAPVQPEQAQQNQQNQQMQQQQTQRQQQTQQTVVQQPVQQQQTAQPTGSGQSGSLSMSKLSQGEIKQLLANAPKTDFSAAELYAQTPSYSAPYAAGKLNPAPLQATLARLNALRRIAGLPAVTLDDSMTNYAQQAALISAAYGTLNHHPGKPAGMDESLYQGAYKGTSSSNLSAGRIITATPDGWMADRDASNIDRLGHRRWQLNPGMGKTGFGYVTTDTGYKRYAAEWSFDNSGRCSDYDFVAWPASGNFPTEVFGNNIAWSVSLNPSKYQTPSQGSLTVTLIRQSDGQQWIFSGNGYSAASSGKYFNVETTNYGVPNCIIFRPDGISGYDGTYTVQIDGLRTSGGQQTSLKYQVDFFSTGENTVTTPKPSQPNNQNNNQNQQNNNNNVNNNNNNTNNNNNNNNTGNNKPNNNGIKKFDAQNAVNPFRDVHDGDYFRDTVLWAVQRGVTKGTSATTFEPYTKCSNADILTMLWRLYSGEEIAISNPFNNVRSSDYYYQPALWAYQLGMVTDKNFNWSAPCTRGTTMRFIWIAAEKIQDSGRIPFTDVSGEFKMPVAWAWNAGIAKGTTDTTFEPDATCTRAEIATFLYRASGGTLK